MKNKTMNAGGYIGYSPSQDAITVIFRGTVPWLIKNWITDIDTVKVDYPLCPSGCKVHKGFYLAFKELQDQVITQFSLLKAKYPNAKVIQSFIVNWESIQDSTLKLLSKLRRINLFDLRHLNLSLVILSN